MSDGTETMAPHPTDGDLVRHLDGEGAAGALDKHLRACDDCRRRYRRIAGWSREVSRVLEEADPVLGDPLAGDRPEQIGAVEVDGVRPPRWMMVAASVMLLLAAALAVQPVRAWVVDQVERVVRGMGFVEPTDPDSGLAAAAISFVPEGRRLRIQLEASQREGRLEVTVARGDRRVRAEVVAGDAAGGGPSPAFAAFPAELRISNGSGSGASYRVTVPARLKELEIRVGSRRLTRLAGQDLRPGDVRTWRLRSAAEPGEPGPPR